MNASRAWLLLCLLHGAAATLLWWAPESVAQAFVWRAGQGVARAWTWWTSAWVHLTLPHLAGNLLTLGALALAGRVLRAPRELGLAWAASWPLSQSSLAMWPAIGYAAGLSGLLHAGVAVLAMHMLLAPAQRGHRPWGTVLLGGLLIKLALEQAWVRPVAWSPAGGLPVVQAAHLAGAAWGLLLGAVAAQRSRVAARSGG